MKRFYLVLSCSLLLFPLFGSEIYRLRFTREGTPYPAEMILTLNSFMDPVAELSHYLDWGKNSIRKDREKTYISARQSLGRVPVLAFHKLGSDDHLELSPQRFEALLIYLLLNNYHVISDHQYIQGDYTYVRNGATPVVLGSDDGASGVFYYETEGDIKTSSFIMDNGSYNISDKSMVYYLDKYLPLENGKRNFTFYITFDAIPFRQTGGGINPGPPYAAMPAVKSKLDYLHRNYYIGNHTMSHYYSEELNELDFMDELIGFYDLMDSYGIPISSQNTVAYSFGIGNLTDERERTMKNFIYKNISIPGAFDYNGKFPEAIDSGRVNPYDISRFGIDNSNFEELVNLLEDSQLFTSRRAVLIQNREFPFHLTELELDRSDLNFILLGK